MILIGGRISELDDLQMRLDAMASELLGVHRLLTAVRARPNQYHIRLAACYLRPEALLSSSVFCFVVGAVRLVSEEETAHVLRLTDSKEEGCLQLVTGRLERHPPCFRFLEMVYW